MAIIGMEGFDHYTTDNGGGLIDDELTLVQDYSIPIYSTNIRLSDTNTRFSTGKYLALIYANALFKINTQAASTTTMYISGAFKFENTIDSVSDIIRFVNAEDTNYSLILKMNTSGNFGFYRNTTLVGSLSANAVSVNTWYWIELRVTIDSSAGVIHLKVNDEDWIPETTGQNTLYTGSPTISNFILTGDANPYVLIDDLVWQDDGGDFLGDSRIETFTPTGDASVTWSRSAGSTNYENIDEIPAVDTDYVYTSTVDAEDLYDFNTIADDDDVHAISLKYRAQKTDTGARSVQSRTSELITGDDVQGGTERALSTSWKWYSDIFETTDDGDPDAGTAWTQTLIGTATFGVKVTV